MASPPGTDVALVGCGHIARLHLQVLRTIRGTRVTALCDPSRTRAQALQREVPGAAVFTDLGELLAARVAGSVHVLTPPHTHAELARACLQAGLHVLVEKPLCLASAEALELGALAAARSLRLGVNHNLVLHPAMLRLQRCLDRQALGRLEHASLVHNVPLRQLQSGDTGHFMFSSEAAILWEQGVHLFSLVHRLFGPAREVAASASDPRQLATGVTFHAAWDVHLQCERGTASVRMAFGRGMPCSRLHLLGSDGSADLDLLQGSCAIRRKGSWPDFLDGPRAELAVGMHHAAHAVRAVVGHAFALFGLRRSQDPYWRSMHGGIRAFHLAVRTGAEPPCTATDAAAVLQTCERAAAAAGMSVAPRDIPPLPAPGPARAGEVVVLGGTGLIGRHAVQVLRRSGRPLTMVVRRPQLLPAELRDGSVRVFAGDAADPAVLRAAFAGADCVLHLATCAGDDPSAPAVAMRAAVAAAAEACRSASVRRLVYASSTAAVWLGAPGSVPGDAPTDPEPLSRAPYAQAKIAAETELQRHRDLGLDFVIVRPAIVTGSGAPLELSGIGVWVTDNHCIGWGRGRTPVPFVLVADCAQALVMALDAKAAAGRTYTLAGPVRPTARTWMAELRARTGRDVHFHPRTAVGTFVRELLKYFVKVLARRGRQWPSLRDLRSRGFHAAVDASAAERDLGFAPQRDPDAFFDAALPRSNR